MGIALSLETMTTSDKFAAIKPRRQASILLLFMTLWMRCLALFTCSNPDYYKWQYVKLRLISFK